MQLIINGENKNFDDNLSIEQIIINLELQDKVMSAAVNMEVVKKDTWKEFIPKDNDKIELLQFVGGG